MLCLGLLAEVTLDNCFICAGDVGQLFYEFYRVLSCLREINIPHQRHLFWLFENVVSMPCDVKTTISRFLQVGVLVNESIVKTVDVDSVVKASQYDDSIVYVVT